MPILFVLSTSAMLILDQRTLQVKYRVPATEIYRLSLSPYLDDVAVFHVKAVSSPVVSLPSVKEFGSTANSQLSEMITCWTIPENKKSQLK